MYFTFGLTIFNTQQYQLYAEYFNCVFFKFLLTSAYNDWLFAIQNDLWSYKWSPRILELVLHKIISTRFDCEWIYAADSINFSCLRCRTFEINQKSFFTKKCLHKTIITRVIYLTNDQLTFHWITCHIHHWIACESVLIQMCAPKLNISTEIEITKKSTPREKEWEKRSTENSECKIRNASLKLKYSNTNNRASVCW